MRPNAGMANRQGDVDLRFAQVSAPVNNLAWPGLAWPGLAWPGLAWPGLAANHQSEGVLCQTQIKKQPSNTSARKQRQTARPRCLVDRGTPLLSQAAAAAAFGPASAPAVIRDDSPWPSGQVQPRIQLRITTTPPAWAQHRTTHYVVAPSSHPATQHPGRGKTNVYNQPRNCMTLRHLCVCVFYCGFHY